jgi:hypothetical protein
MSASCAEILRDYGGGRRPVQDVLDVCRSYRGPEPHFLWAKDCACCTTLRSAWNCAVRGAFINDCFEAFPEERLYELLRALGDANPDFPRIRDRKGRSFLMAALRPVPGGAPVGGPPAVTSGRVLVLLSVSGTTRDSNIDRFRRCHPLHRACSIPAIDPAVVNHLLDLDPDLLLEAGVLRGIPLHQALEKNPTASFISRMIELRPESLLRTIGSGGTPVDAALQGARPSPEAARVLQRLVLQCPASVSSGRERQALVDACRRFHQHPDLIQAIVQADPTLLGAAEHGLHDRFEFPFQMVAAAHPTTREFVEKETVEVALAVVENVLGAAYAPKRGVYELSHLALFRRHVWRTMTAYLEPDQRQLGTSGFAVAQALRALDDPRRMDLCRDLFCGDERSRRLLSSNQRTRKRLPGGGAPSLHDEIMGSAFAGLYQLNRRDRSNPSWAHQVRLLESVNDNLDCIFLHVRTVACVILVGDGR